MTRSPSPALRQPMLALLAVTFAALTACGGGEPGDDRDTSAGNDNQALGTDATADGEGHRQIASLATVRGKRVVPTPTITVPAPAPEPTPSPTPAPSPAPAPAPDTGTSTGSGSATQELSAEALNQTLAAAISVADVVAQARPAIDFASQEWGSMQCNGLQYPSAKIPAAGIYGSTLPDGNTLRFGRVADPTDASKLVYRYTLDQADPVTAGSYRCELAFAANTTHGVPRGTTFWHAFSVYVPDWRATNDEQALAQWHAGDTSGGMLPVYTLLVRGKTMRLVLRYNTQATPSRSTTQAIVVWSTNFWQPNRWLTFVTQARMTTNSGQSPFVKTWLNGSQIVNYSGPVGYNQPGVQAYAKHGIYHWVDITNPWDTRLPTRTIHMRHPLMVQDPSMVYTQDQIAALVATN